MNIIGFLTKADKMDLINDLEMAIKEIEDDLEIGVPPHESFSMVRDIEDMEMEIQELKMELNS